MSGFFGAALGELGSLVSSQHAGAAEGLLATALQNSGGVPGLIAKFQQAGMGAHVSSWIGSGTNLPISAADIERVFPPDQIEAFAAQHGVPAGVASQILAAIVPHAVAQAAPAPGTTTQAADADPT